MDLTARNQSSASIHSQTAAGGHSLKRPSVTFVMAARNAAKTIKRSMDSVICQDYDGDVRLIVVDDASTDDTYGIVAGYPDVLLLSNESRLGRSRSRNRALQQVTTELVAIQDADDYSLPHRLSETVGLLGRNASRIAGGQVEWMDPSGQVFQGACWPQAPADTKGLLLRGHMPIAHPTMIAPLKLMLAVGGYDPAYPVGEDLDLLLRIMHRFPELEFVNAQSTISGYRRRQLDSYGYLLRAAYWRARVIHANSDRTLDKTSVPWFSEATLGYVRQRAKRVKNVLGTVGHS
ncbi:glycosyltransferase family 2 protein [Pseudarthrobacter enclensis]|uniref:Glycosyltransferase involved in cell wall biosynthesis n=1 Tax=Pseudarthrobacter enclensis TaxID=993070 RepID=A0ABT9RX51_9MICC|nr:glycosyltransferase [Pseudarthrobacter enclensis]MDP9889820.1 glycosyltransferase involved in cell wall biosynthesis [Pseudarthrobacter enclensis]